MRTLIIDCTAFLLHLVVYVLGADGEAYQREYMDITDVINYAIAQKDIKSIKLAGPTEYCMGLKETFEAKLALEYADHNIEIEVI